MTGWEIFFWSLLVMLLLLALLGGIILLVLCIRKPDEPETAETRLRQTHEQTINDIDDVVSYYVGLQQYVSDRLEELSPSPRESGPRSGR